ncbi:hypothetical protein BGZ81_000526, partial [Podila clonocystis]
MRFLTAETVLVDAITTCINNTERDQKFDVAKWEDLRKVVVIDINGHTLEAIKFGLRIWPNHLEIDNFGR